LAPETFPVAGVYDRAHAPCFLRVVDLHQRRVQLSAARRIAPGQLPPPTAFFAKNEEKARARARSVALSFVRLDRSLDRCAPVYIPRSSLSAYVRRSLNARTGFNESATEGPSDFDSTLSAAAQEPALRRPADAPAGVSRGDDVARPQRQSCPRRSPRDEPRPRAKIWFAPSVPIPAGSRRCDAACAAVQRLQLHRSDRRDIAGPHWSELVDRPCRSSQAGS